VRIGIVGAGMIGSTLAKLWVDAGHEVRLASRHPENLQPLVEGLGTRASAGTPMDVATFGDVVMLTVPLKAVPDLARDLAPSVAGKVVLDTGNAYERRVIVGSLARGKEFEPDTRPYNTGMSGPELRTVFGQASTGSDRQA
jgi:predicted dinucleotide-binding enzyme